MTASILATLVNLQRLNANLPAITTDTALSHAAQVRADGMARSNLFSHKTKEGWNVWHFMPKGYHEAGENLAKGFDNETDTVTAWMNSPTHKANILDKDWNKTGFGIASNSTTTYIVEFFAD